ncbi:MAG: F0F1 ATP synthase subunit epsilon [Gaiellales bacterium]|nr:F0F1 ATP synthase subunit epsilon [Gaiellales bacterium]
MRLRVLLPTQVLLDREVSKLTAEAEEGAFGMLPRHIDFVTMLEPGILTYTLVEGPEEFMAIDEGVLVKCGTDVSISTRRAVRSPQLDALREAVREEFRIQDDREKATKSALAKLQADFVRRFLDMGKVS